MGKAALNYDHLNYSEVAFVREALNRPPKFGDTYQIRALKLIKPPPLEEGKIKRFRVTVEFSGEFDEYVDANSKEEAIEEIGDYIGSIPDGCDVDITAVEVEL